MMGRKQSKDVTDRARAHQWRFEFLRRRALNSIAVIELLREPDDERHLKVWIDAVDADIAKDIELREQIETDLVSGAAHE